MSEILTYTRVMFDPLNPDPALIRVRDIAHSLSMLCRANGHFTSFYSVGMHSLNCAAEAAARGHSVKVQLACLLHDASESYLADVTRPVKKELPRYLEIEKPLQDAIWLKFLGESLTEEETKQVFAIDDAVLWYEFVELMETKLSETAPPLLSKPEFVFPGFGETETAFIKCFRELSEKLESF